MQHEAVDKAVHGRQVDSAGEAPIQKHDAGHADAGHMGHHEVAQGQARPG